MELRPIFVVAALVAASLALADGAYRWVDENGVVHYSDVPVEGAELVNLSEYSRETGARIALPGAQHQLLREPRLRRTVSVRLQAPESEPK